MRESGLFHHLIEFWRDEDSAAWEEGRKVNNSSVAPLSPAWRRCESPFPSLRPQAPGVVPISTGRSEKLEMLIQKGTNAWRPHFP